MEELLLQLAQSVVTLDGVDRAFIPLLHALTLRLIELVHTRLTATDVGYQPPLFCCCCCYKKKTKKSK